MFYFIKGLKKHYGYDHPDFGDCEEAAIKFADIVKLIPEVLQKSVCIVIINVKYRFVLIFIINFIYILNMLCSGANSILLVNPRIDDAF